MKKFKIAALTLAMVAGFALSAVAADWNFYGSARVETFVTDKDNPAGTSDTKSLSESLQGNSRIGASVKVSDELTGGFEYGTGVNVRKLYGEWNFGAGKFLVGQTYTPMNWFYSNQVYGVDNDLLAQGGLYSGREAMLQLTFGSFKIAAVAPDTDDLGTGFSSEVDIPAIEASYTYTVNNLTLEVAGGYQSYELVSGATTYDIDSYVVALGGMVNFGPAFFNANVYSGENAGSLIEISVDGDNAWDDGLAAISGNQVLDNDCFGFVVVAGYKFNDMFTMEAGYGYAETELDNAVAEDEVASYYVNATVTLAPGVFFVPEIGKIDGEESTDIDTTYYGVKWQINF